MGKMPLRDKERGRRRERSPAQPGVKLQQLFIREGQEKALEKHYGFAKAGVDVVVRGVQQVPLELGLHGGRVVQLFRGATKGLVETFDQLHQGGNFVKKLRALA